MFTRSLVPLTGNDQYEGHNIDLLKALSEMLGFKYKVRLAADKGYGSLKNGKWNGMIKEVMDGVSSKGFLVLTK